MCYVMTVFLFAKTPFLTASCLDAGVIGNYAEARMLARRTPSGIINGIQDANGNYVNDTVVPTLNVTEGTQVVLVLAFATRICYIEAIAPEDDLLPGYDIK